MHALGTSRIFKDILAKVKKINGSWGVYGDDLSFCNNVIRRGRFEKEEGERTGSRHTRHGGFHRVENNFQGVSSSAWFLLCRHLSPK